ncbi:chaperonin 10-like protein [Mycena polygramma]|nr:chaperonin 10-like protein [Mycena polygramma]
MSTQQAIVVQSPKAPFTLGSTEIPSPAQGEVLIKVMSVSLNPGNWKQREFDMLVDEYPAVLGNDIAGVIEEIGEGVEDFKKGDRVFSQVVKGGFQQYSTAPAAILIPIPGNLSFDQASTVPSNFTTACVGLFAAAPLGLGLNPTFSWDTPRQGESALVLGGATSIGQFAIELFKFLGYTRIVVYASKAHFAYLRQLGATECIDRVEVSLDSLATQAALTPGVKVVYHTVDLAALNAAYDCLAEGGSIVTALPSSQLDRDLSAKKAALVGVRGFIAGQDVMKYNHPFAEAVLTPEHTKFGKLIIKNLPEMLEKGIITTNRYEVLPNGVSGIIGGLERLQRGSVSGVKLVAHPQDPTA